MASEEHFNLLEDEEFYKSCIFKECNIEGIKDVTVSQLLTIDTQQLYDDVNKENIGLEQTIQQTNNKHGTGTMQGRFEKPLSATDIKMKQRNAVPENTTRNNSGAISVWREWVENRNMQPETAMEPGYPIPVEIDKFHSFAEMDFWLQRFICEIRRKNGEPYPPSTLQNIAAGIQRYLRTEKSVHVNFFKSDDPTFAEFRKTLDSHMRQLTNKGIGLETKSADAVTAEDECRLWESGVFSFSTSKGLSNAVFYYNGKVFGLIGGDEQIGLLAEQFVLGYDSANKRRFVKFTPRIRKNAQGGLKQSKKTTGIMQPIVHYDSAEGGEFSIYRLYETYLNLIPRTGSFYRKPLDGFKFSAGNIPQKDIKSMMKTLFAQADIAIGSGNISNHSGRVTLCSTLFNKRYADKTVMNRSKHVSSAVHRYRREQFDLQSAVSSELEPKLPEKFKAETSLVPETKICETKTEKNYGNYETGCNENVISDKTNTGSNTLSMQLPSGVKKVVLQTYCGKRIVIEI